MTYSAWVQRGEKHRNVFHAASMQNRCVEPKEIQKSDHMKMSIPQIHSSAGQEVTTVPFDSLALTHYRFLQLWHLGAGVAVITLS